MVDRMRWGAWISVLLIAAACGGNPEDDGGGESETGADCNCPDAAYVPVCGVDGMTHDAACGVECVGVEIECMGECPCAASTGSTTSTTETTGDATSSGSTTSMAETTMGVDPCDCQVGAYYPVCGVDGMTYDASCGIECVEVEILCEGFECPCPELACGDMMCEATEPVCTVSLPGPKGPTIYDCGPIPPECDGVEPPTCDCVMPLRPRGCSCTEDPVGHFEVTCAFP